MSIDVVAGATHVLPGSSGSGKSTVLGLILGLTAPDEGAGVVNGAVVAASTRAALVRRMGDVVQDGGLFDAAMLSGGERQRIGLMRAPMLDPPILLRSRPTVVSWPVASGRADCGSACPGESGPRPRPVGRRQASVAGLPPGGAVTPAGEAV